MSVQHIISLIENIDSFDHDFLNEHEINKKHFQNFSSTMELAEKLGYGDMAISYYNFIYLKRVYGCNASSMFYRWNKEIGTEDLANSFITLSSTNIINKIESQPAWGRKEILSLPHGVEIANTMKEMNKTSLGTKDIIYILFGIKAKVIGFTYYTEFVDMMKLEKTMINKKTAQNLLRTFWENTKDDYKSNHLLFNTIKSTIINLNSKLKDSNSTQQLRLEFMKEFLINTTEVN